MDSAIVVERSADGLYLAVAEAGTVSIPSAFHDTPGAAITAAKSFLELTGIDTRFTPVMRLYASGSEVVER